MGHYYTERRLCVRCGKEFRSYPANKKRCCSLSCATILRSQETVPMRLLERIDFTQGDCWIWTGVKGNHGYGIFSLNQHKQVAHRAVYELLVGPIPDGRELDHTCHNLDLSCPGGSDCRHRLCVNPMHLDPVSHRTNVLRGGRSTSAVNARKTHCLRGHAFTVDNTYVSPQGHRLCRACRRVREAAAA